MTGKPGSESTLKILSAVIPALLLGLNLLVFGTLIIYNTNQGEFLVPYSGALRNYYLPGMMVFVAIGLLSLLLRQGANRAFNAIIILFGILTYIHGNLMLWNTGILDGSHLDLSSNWRSVADALLWVALAWAAWRYRDWLAVHGWKICTTLILFQAIGALSILDNNSEPQTPNGDVFPDELAFFSHKKNVIHIILDGFQASIFEQILADNPDFNENFSGFTFFRDATTSSDVTSLSVPATLSGKAFKNNQPISAYQEAVLEGDNLYRFFDRHDFAIDVATAMYWNRPNPLFSSYYRIPAPYADTRQRLLSTSLLLLDISLFRQAPHFLKPQVYGSGAWLLSGKLVSNPEQQFEHFAHHAFFADFQDKVSVVPTRPRYKFIHLVSPHAPLVSAADCKFAGAALEYSKQSFTRQSLCTLKAIISFLDRLKARGVYDNSMLIIHGDHGGGVPFDMVLENGEKTNSAEALHRVWGNPLPLVLVKPMGATGNLQVSNQPVQLLDVPATLADQLGFESNFPGHSMFKDRNAEAVERNYFTSKINRNDAAVKDHFDEFTSYSITGSIYRLASWREVDTYVAPATDDAGRYQWNTEISFGNRGNYGPLQNGGWAKTSTSDASWTLGSRASLSITFPDISGPVSLHARIKPLLAPGKLDRQRVNIYVNTEKAGEWLVSSKKFDDAELIIPEKLFSRVGKTEIRFELPDARSPQSLGLSREKRVLALAFLSIKFKHLPDPSAAR